MNPTRPVMRYHGGKWLLAPWILSNMPPHTVYVEAFGGAASVLMQKKPLAAEVYNDLDGAVVNVFRVLQDRERAERLRDRLALTPFSRAEFNRSYEPATDDVDFACKMIVRSFFGFSTDAMTRGCRTGFHGRLTDKRGLPSQGWREWPDSVAAFVDRLRGVLIEQTDAVDLIRHYDTDQTLFYLDPPYVVSSRSVLKGKHRKSHGYRHEMSDDAHAGLAEALHGVSGMVMLSGYDSPLYRDLFPTWFRLERKSLADGAKVRTECLWLNPHAADFQDTMKLFDVYGTEQQRKEACQQKTRQALPNGTGARRSTGAASGAGNTATSSSSTRSSAPAGPTTGSASAKTTTAAKRTPAAPAKSARAATRPSVSRVAARAKTAQ